MADRRYNKSYAPSHGKTTPRGDQNRKPQRPFTAMPGGSVIKGTSTLFEMKIAPGRTVHRYAVTITKLPKTVKGKPKVLSRLSDQGLRSFQRKICLEILEYTFQQTDRFGTKSMDCIYVYDGKATLFTSEPLKLTKKNVFTYDAVNLPPNVCTFLRGAPIEVVIDDLQLKLDYSNLAETLVENVKDTADRSVRQFLELATSQHFISGGTAEMMGAGTLFDTKVYPLCPGIQFRQGLTKGVKVTAEGGTPKALLVADMRKSAFFSTATCDKILENMRYDARSFNTLFRGVRMGLSYNTGQTFTCLYLTNEAIGHEKFKVNGRTIPQYFKAKYNLDVSPKSVGLIPDMPNGKNMVFPLELCSPLPGQLVPCDKLVANAMRQLLFENSVQPDVRYSYVQSYITLMASGESAKFLGKLGIKIDPSPVKVDIMSNTLPKVIAGANRQISVAQNGSFMNDAVQMKLYNPSTRINGWWIVYDKTAVVPGSKPGDKDRRPEMRMNDLIARYAANDLVKYATNAGMKMTMVDRVIGTTFEELQKVFEVAAEENRKAKAEQEANKGQPNAKQGRKHVQFIFYIDNSSKRTVHDAHARLKLFESHYDILTQHMLTKNVYTGIQTKTNIIMKLNVKSFGLNYLPQYPESVKEFDLQANNDVLVIGYDVAHPAPETPKARAMRLRSGATDEKLHPSVVGVCANVMANGNGFAGDFFYQEPRTEKVNPVPMEACLTRLLQRAKAKKRTAKKVIIVRDGVSEGQHKMIADDELPIIRKVITNVFTAECQSKITFLVATKRHNKRFYQLVGNNVNNTQPGNVIQSGVVRSDVCEFYEQTHAAIKGVPKMTQYLVLANELGLDKTQIQTLMLSFAYLHQICALPTSLPLPVYMADELAKRGTDIYNAYCQLERQNTIRAGEQTTNSSQVAAYDWLTMRLGYSQNVLGSTRFNA